MIIRWRPFVLSFFLLMGGVAALPVSLVPGSLPAVSALEIDRSELEAAAGADIEFESFLGEVQQFDTAQAIRGIGSALGQGAAEDETYDYFNRYIIRRIIGDPLDRRRAADIIEFSPAARVDHIENVRRILSEFLITAWGYQRGDADLLARFITIYNAVHRGDMDFFVARYREAVSNALDPQRVGIALSYRDWPGQTQMVVPLRGGRDPGDLDAVDPGQLVGPAVIGDLRSRADLGIDDRKAIIEFIERVVEVRLDEIALERAEIEEEREEIARRREDLQQDPAPALDADPQDPLPEATPHADEDDLLPPETPREDPEHEVDQDPEPDRPVQEDAPAPPPEDESLEDEEALREREEALDQREEELLAEEAELGVLMDQLEELYQDTAEDQATLHDRAAPPDLVPFVLADGQGGYEIAVVNLDGPVLAERQIIPLAGRTVLEYRGGLLAVHRGTRRMLLLEPSSLSVRAESERSVRPGSRVVFQGNSILTLIEENGAAFVGEFDSDLVLVRRSADAVSPDTDIVVRGDHVLVQGSRGDLRVLNLQ
ncbi:P83/100 family protein [Alkalispirochaeta americana]|nr:P83/100 family protein [Alkalispirochaeta americana]